MKIIQVLTYVSEQGAYGGPVAVARAQCAELAHSGHEVHLVAGWDGQAQLEIPGVTVHLRRAVRLPGLGFAGTIAPGVWWTARRLAKSADVVHLHLARDLVQLPTAVLVKPALTVAQPHGMVTPDSRPAARVVDALLTRRAFRRIASLFALTTEEVDYLSALGHTSAIRLLRNGVPTPPATAKWSPAPTVVFVARLHRRKRPVEFVQMAHEISTSNSQVRFLMFGPDEGEAENVRSEIDRLGLADVLAYSGPLVPEQVLPTLLGAQVYVLPSIDEPFPMSVLEAMSCGLPSVITDRTGISAELATRQTATVTDGSPSRMAEAVLRILASQDGWEHASAAAQRDIKENFSSAAIGDSLLHLYAEGLGRRDSRG